LAACINDERRIEAGQGTWTSVSSAQRQKSILNVSMIYWKSSSRFSRKSRRKTEDQTDELRANSLQIISGDLSKARNEKSSEDYASNVSPFLEIKKSFYWMDEIPKTKAKDTGYDTNGSLQITCLRLYRSRHQLHWNWDYKEVFKCQRYCRRLQYHQTTWHL